VKARTAPPAWLEAAELLAPLGPWFEASRRNLPWRAKDLDGHHPDPYAVLVSELMLQQTQVGTVVPYFERWMRVFPDLHTLAGASEDAIHKQWEGLGYYRRARHLQAAARAIAASGWPDRLEGLLNLPGLGPYSAAAVAAIAFQRPEPALDGNALRVTARLLALEDPAAVQNQLRDWLRPALSRHGASRTTQALMELGARICLPRNPLCSECVLSAACAAKSTGSIDTCPGARRRPARREIELQLVALACEDRWLLERPAGKGLLAGLWRWPAFPLPAPEPRAAEATMPFGIEEATLLSGWVQTYSHRRERVSPWLIRISLPLDPGPGRDWVPGPALHELPMGRRDARLRSLVLGPVTPSGGTASLATILASLQRK
jgi:A/G-specific adenine glycosylase